jgi:hypothetical protein
MLLIVWVLSMVIAGTLVGTETGSLNYGAAVTLGLLAVSLGVPLTRALTEFSK